MALKYINKLCNKKLNMLHYFKPMLITLLICGFNYKYSKFRPTFRICLNIYCLILVIVALISTYTCCDSESFSRSWSLIEYVSSVIIILLCRDQISTFFQKLAYIDSCLRINIKHYYHNKIKAYILVFFVWLVRILHTYTYCNYRSCYNELFIYLVSLISSFSLDLNRVWRYLVFDLIRHRLRLLRLRLEEMPESNSYFYVTNQKTVKENKIRFSLHLYKTLAEAFELIAPELFASMLVSVCCSLPKLISNVYEIILVIEKHSDSITLWFAIGHLTQIFVFLFLPCLVVELYSMEVENIKLFLMNKLLEESDDSAKVEIDLFLRYIEVRTFQYKMWRMIPMNLGLPLDIISLCTTYVIVVINFTHLY